jgi:hypothetical protein
MRQPTRHAPQTQHCHVTQHTLTVPGIRQHTLQHVLAQSRLAPALCVSARPSLCAALSDL